MLTEKPPEPGRTGMIRSLPDHLDSYSPVRAHVARAGERDGTVPPLLDAAISAAGLSDGATLSFHHHLRNGDVVLNAMLDACARRGQHVTVGTIIPVHARLVDDIRHQAMSAATCAGPHIGGAVVDRRHCDESRAGCRHAPPAVSWRCPDTAAAA